MRFIFSILVLLQFLSLAVAKEGLNVIAERYSQTATVENSELKVAVESCGAISVFDKECGHLWKQDSSPNHAQFKIFLKGTNSISFETSFFSVQSLPAYVKLQLAGRALKLEVSMDTNTPFSSFDFLEPFQVETNMSLAVPDFCDGHLYPCDLKTWPQYNLDSIRVLNLTMPWVAVVDLSSGMGYSVIVDTPYDAQLKLASVAGLRYPQVAWNGELNHFGYVRSLTYTFTAHGGYVALAKAYRQQARVAGLLMTLDDKARTRPAITNLFGAPVLWDFNDSLPDLTLRARGLTRAIHHVERWDAGSASRQKLDLANRLGFVTEEYDYYLAGILDGRAQYYQNYHINASECVKDASGQIVCGEHNWGMRCSGSYVPTAERIIPDRLKAFPQTARYFDQITQNFNGHDNGPHGGGSTEECFDPAHPKTRTAWVNDVDNFYRYAAQTLGLITGAELGKFHQVPDTELFYGMESWYWPWPDVVFPDDRGADTNAWNTYEHWAMNPAVRVPLWQLVFHDCTIGTLYPWDGNDVCFKIGETNQDLKDCLNLLYGTPATFMVKGQGGSQYFHQPQRWLQSYRNTCKLLETLADKEMVAHSFLSLDRLVQETDWSDGTHTIVNFGTNDFTIEGKVLRQFCFFSKGPWGSVARIFDSSAGRLVTTMSVPGYRFDDFQLSAGKLVCLALTLEKPDRLRINVDEIPGQTVVPFVIRPATVKPDWNLAGSHVYRCDPVDGRRVCEIPWKKSGADGIEVSKLSGWIVLDIDCSTNNGSLQSARFNKKANSY